MITLIAVYLPLCYKYFVAIPLKFMKSIMIDCFSSLNCHKTILEIQISGEQLVISGE